MEDFIVYIGDEILDAAGATGFYLVVAELPSGLFVSLAIWFNRTNRDEMTQYCLLQPFFSVKFAQYSLSKG